MKPVNLLPDGDRSRFTAEPVDNGAYAVLGVLGLLLIGAVLFVTTGNTINSHKSDLAEAEAATAKARSVNGELSPFQQFAAIRQARESAIESLAGGRFDWERLVRELSVVLPDGVWLTNVNASSAGAPGGTEAPTPLPGDAAVAGTPAVQITGCATGQRQVAVMMVRLRQMHRAVDVELAESAEEEGAETGSGLAAATTGGAGDAPTEDGCGSGNYKFDATVNFAANQATVGGSAPSGRTPARLGGGE